MQESLLDRIKTLTDALYSMEGCRAGEPARATLELTLSTYDLNRRLLKSLFNVEVKDEFQGLRSHLIAKTNSKLQYKITN